MFRLALCVVWALRRSSIVAGVPEMPPTLCILGLGALVGAGMACLPCGQRRVCFPTCDPWVMEVMVFAHA